MVMWVGVLFLVGVCLAHGTAELVAFLEAGSTPPGGGQSTALWAGNGADAYRVKFMLWVTALLLAPALPCCLSQPGGLPSACRRSFWTFAYLGYLVYLLWSLFAATGRDLAPLRQDGLAWLAGVLALLWGLDVALAWNGPTRYKVGEKVRAAVPFFACLIVMMLLFRSGGAVSWLLLILLGLVIVFCLVLHVSMRYSDPESLPTALYFKTLQLLYPDVPWDKLASVRPRASKSP